MLRNRVFFVLQATLKYIPWTSCARARGALYRPFFERAGANLRIHDGVLVKYPDEISVGNNVTVNPGCIISGRGGLVIGSDVMIGAGSKIATTSHRSDRRDVPMRVQGLEARSILIEDDVWLGFDVKVLPGAVVRRGAILGAGAVVVAGEIPAYSIAVGVPARVVDQRPS